MTVRTALKNSLNIPAVKVLQAIGVQTAQRYLRSVGIELDERDANLSLALGSMTYGTSPMQMAAAYAPFANGGTYYAPYFIERITDRDGNVIYERETTGTRVLSAPVRVSDDESAQNRHFFRHGHTPLQRGDTCRGQNRHSQ